MPRMYRRVRDEEIADEPLFPISRPTDLDGLKASLMSVGQLSPLILRPGRERLRLVCGVRRRQVMRDLGGGEYEAMVLDESVSTAMALRLALEDNRTRGFNDGEKVLAVGHLANYFSPGEVTEQYLPLLGLPPRTEYFERFLKLGGIGPRGLDALAHGHLDPESAEGLMRLDVESRAAVSDLISELSPGRNKRRQIIVWLEEIGRREGVSPAEVLRAPEVKAILEADRLSRPQKEGRVREVLRARRFPMLSALGAEQRERMKALNLPPHMKLMPPPHFEGLDFTLEITFSRAEELAESARLIEKMADHPDLHRLVELG